MINVIGLGLNLKVWKYGLFFADSIENVLGTFPHIGFSYWEQDLHIWVEHFVYTEFAKAYKLRKYWWKYLGRNYKKWLIFILGTIFKYLNVSYLLHILRILSKDLRTLELEILQSRPLYFNTCRAKPSLYTMPIKRLFHHCKRSSEKI